LATRLPLRWRLLITSLLGAAPLVVLGAVLLYAYYTSSRHEVLNANRALAELAATYMRGWTDGNLRILRTLAGANETLHGTLADKQGLIDRQIRQQPDWADLFIADAGGRVIASSRNARLDIHDRAYFQQARRTGAPVVTTMLASRVTGKPVLFFVYPIQRGGRFLGIVGATVNTSTLQRIFEAQTLPNGTILAIWDRDRHLILRTDTAPSMLGKTYPNLDPVIFSGRRGSTFGISPLTGKPTLIGFAPVEGTPWIMVTATPQATALAPVWQSVLYFALLTLVVLVLTTAWAFYTANGLAGQISALAAGARAIGRGDFTTRVASPAVPELDALATTINTMAGDLAVSERVKTDLLSMVSHELKTPLTVIHASLEMLTARAIDPAHPRFQEVLEIAERQALRLQDMIDNLLNAARLEMGQLVVEPRPTVLRPIIAAAAALSAEAAREHGLTLSVEMPEELRVLADAQKVTLALNNLLDNAVKFTREGGIILRAARDGHEAVVTVTDTGAGFPPEVGAHLFERFFQAEPILTRRAGGAGLGLYVVKALIEAQGGRVFAESPGPDRGSTFGFTLPLAE
jgi:signal transduction histidine kinase